MFRKILPCLLAVIVSAACSKPLHPELSVDRDAVEIGAAGGSTELSVTSNTSWTVSSTQSWLSVSPNHGDGSSEVSLFAVENKAVEGLCAARRSGEVIFAFEGRTVRVKVTQDREPAVFTVLGGEIGIGCAGGTVSVRVEHNISYRVTLPSDAGWLRRIDTKAVAVDNIQLQVDANVGAARQASVSFISGPGEEKTVLIRQEASDDVFAEGDGTEAKPFLISSADELARLSRLSNSGLAPKYASSYFVQTADIDASGVDFKPLFQNAAVPFEGSYDGAGLKISRLRIDNGEELASGFVGYARGASINGVNLVDADVNSEYVYAGSIAGFVSDGSSIIACSVSGKVRAYKSGITAEGVANAGFSGGIAGRLEGSTVRSCTVDADVSLYGKFSGGVVGYSFNSTVEDCHFLKERALNIFHHFNGGVVGRARGAGNIVKGCSFEGNYTTVGYVQGGIVGQMFGGVVEECVFGSYAYMGSDKYFVGGICGTIQPESPCTVQNCSSYGTIRGLYSVGGIVGYAGIGHGASDTELVKSGYTRETVIRNCAFIRGTLTSTGGNSGGYAIVGGILGWSHGSGSLTINGCYSLPGLIQTTYGSNVNGVFSGICSYQNSAGGALIENCYTAFTSGDFLLCNERVDTRTSLWYAGIHVRCTAATTVRNCFSESGLRVGYSSASATESGCGQFSIAQMTDGTLLARLQSTSDGTSWIAGADGFPTTALIPSDPNVKPAAARRVSVIGDSISTFRGWIPGGYGAHYPATDGALTLVNETYWHRLVYKYMKDAAFDTNISFSGTAVTNTTAANYAARYGSQENSWWHNSFTERFAACGGCGKPDIILIHGGTNDFYHNADPLAPGLAIRNDASNPYGGDRPSDSVMDQLFAVGDAASTRSQVNALPDGTFCEAYIKLMCQIRERYPRCKVVCIIGDCVNTALEQSVTAIAGHYGAKTVNLLRVNGFNDLGGYSEATFTNRGTQPNMPKHDYNGDASGCHPGAVAMDFIANRIYTELGAWLEE